MKMHIDPDGLPNPLFHVALIEPEIPNNTGNIGRICVGLRARLHIVGKPAFEITDSRVKRAGLDYWSDLDLVQHEGLDEFMGSLESELRVFFLSTKAQKSLYETELRPGDVFVFGKETKGIDDEVLERFPEQVLGLPMLGPIRSQNLANTVAVVMYEGIRQVVL